jgi:hypothetical protein
MGNIPSHGILDSKGDGSDLGYQVAILQDCVRLGQHLLSALRAELKQEKLVECFILDISLHTYIM